MHTLMINIKNSIKHFRGSIKNKWFNYLFKFNFTRPDLLKKESFETLNELSRVLTGKDFMFNTFDSEKNIDGFYACELCGRYKNMKGNKLPFICKICLFISYYGVINKPIKYVSHQEEEEVEDNEYEIKAELIEKLDEVTDTLYKMINDLEEPANNDENPPKSGINLSEV